MRRALAAAAALLLAIAPAAQAHRVDEYLQAAMLQISSGRLELVLRLAPGASVAGTVLDSIDLNRDGTLSPAEKQTYARRVLRDLSLSLDGKPIALTLVGARFDSPGLLEGGTGEIQITFDAPILAGRGPRRLQFTNQHRSAISAYLVNSLVPADSAIRIASQERDYRQSSYTLDYVQAAGTAPFTSGDSSGVLLLLAGGCVLAVGDRVRRWLRA